VDRADLIAEILEKAFHLAESGQPGDHRKASENPVAYVGGGNLLAKASGELAEFATHMGLRVAHSLMGKGALRDDHPLVMGMTGFWGTELVNQACLNADYVFAVDTPLLKWAERQGSPLFCHQAGKSYSACFVYADGRSNLVFTTGS
jgi:acetolactate synthase I/II/III large subunit